jgi:hypothetical protein
MNCFSRPWFTTAQQPGEPEIPPGGPPEEPGEPAPEQPPETPPEEPGEPVPELPPETPPEFPPQEGRRP